MVRNYEEQIRNCKEQIKDIKKVIRAQKREDNTIKTMVVLSAIGLYGSEFNPTNIGNMLEPSILLPALSSTAIIAFTINSLINTKRYRNGLKDELKAYKQELLNLKQEQRQMSVQVKTR